MTPNFWDSAEVRMNYTSNYKRRSTWGSIESIKTKFRNQVKYVLREDNNYESRYVFPLNIKWNKEEGCSISVKIWVPYTCQGGFFETIELTALPAREIEILWTRSKSPIDCTSLKKVRQTPVDIARGFDLLFDIILSFGLKKIQIKKTKHNLVLESEKQSADNRTRVRSRSYRDVLQFAPRFFVALEKHSFGTP